MDAADLRAIEDYIKSKKLHLMVYRIESMIAHGIEARAQDASRNTFADICALYTRALGTVRELKVLYGSEDKPAAGTGTSCMSGHRVKRAWFWRLPGSRLCCRFGGVLAAAGGAELTLERDQAAIASLAAKELTFIAFRCFQAGLSMVATAKVQQTRHVAFVCSCASQQLSGTWVWV